MKDVVDHETISLAFGKDPVYGTLQRSHKYLTHITRVMRNVCPARAEFDVPDSISTVELIRKINSMISGEDKRLLEDGIGVYYDSEKAHWDFIVRDAKFDGQCRIFDCSFLEHLRIADLHLYDIIIATLSHVWRTIRIPTWTDLLDQVLDDMTNDVEWGQDDSDEEGGPDARRQHVNSFIEPYRTGAPGRCLSVIYKAHKRLSWSRLKRVVDAYNWNTPQKEKVLAWYKAAEKLCKTVTHDFRYYCSHDFPDNGEFVHTWELYGMYWSDGGPVDFQFDEYMNNNLGNFEPMPMLYSITAETPLDKVRAEDSDLRMIDDWMVQSCHVLDYGFMQDYFNGQRAYKRWVNEVYTPIVTKPKSPLLSDILLEAVNVY